SRLREEGRQHLRPLVDAGERRRAALVLLAGHAGMKAHVAARRQQEELRSLVGSDCAERRTTMSDRRAEETAMARIRDIDIDGGGRAAREIDQGGTGHMLP